MAKEWFSLLAVIGLLMGSSAVMKGCDKSMPLPTENAFYWDAREIHETWQYTHGSPAFNTEQIFTSGIYSWRIYIPELKGGEPSGIGTWISCDDRHEVSFKVSRGNELERHRAHCLPGEVLVHLSNLNGPSTQTSFPVSTGWHEFAIRLDEVDGHYDIH